MLTVEFFNQALASKSTATLQRTIARSQGRISRLQSSGLNNGQAEQNEINRIQAATNILSGRGFYDTKKATKSGQGGGVMQKSSKAWMMPAAILLIGIVIFRRVI